MVEPEPHEISQLLSSIPIRSVHDAEWGEFAERFVELCQVFDIDARVGADGGISYRESHPEDSALRMALEVLLARRLNHPGAGH